MRTRLLAAVLATTIATGCLHPEPCAPSSDRFERAGCQAEKKIDGALGIGLGLLVVGVLILISDSYESGGSSASAPVSSSGVRPHSRFGRQALAHAAAGRCPAAVAAYEQLRASAPASARNLSFDDDLAACIAIEDARARGAMP